ncbi:MAG: ATP-binding protein, partial [Rhodothermales bacterium]
FQDLPFSQNALRFEFAFPSYNDPEENEFQYWLEGREAGWSAWTKETGKNYTNLFEGTYRFHIRGRNAQGYVSPASTYTFTVLPPWYRSNWAYGIYVLGLLGMGLFVRRHQRMVVENRRARKQAKELARERQVNERLQDLNKRLEQANETLRQADRLKDEFLANTSHELRTPLTGILGCSAILREEVDEDHREFVNMIDENGQRLLNTLDSLLDLARLRAGLMELDFKEIDLGVKAESVLHTYTSLAASKGIDIDVEAEGDVTGWFDDHCVDCILNNLVGNAVKFTDEGRVQVTISGTGEGVVIRVLDTGVGIDEEFMPFLFDEFKQESTGLTRSHEGNGLGLAVTARIVDLMGGDIDVQSTKHVGTTFTIRLPLEQVRPEYAGHGDGLSSNGVVVEASEPGAEDPSA